MDNIGKSVFVGEENDINNNSSNKNINSSSSTTTNNWNIFEGGPIYESGRSRAFGPRSRLNQNASEGVDNNRRYTGTHPLSHNSPINSPPPCSPSISTHLGSLHPSPPPPPPPPPPPLWNEEKWTDTFTDTHIYAAAGLFFPPLIVGFGLFGAKIFGLADDKCDPGAGVAQSLILEAMVAQQRLRFKVRFCIVSLLIVAGSNFMGIAMMDFLEIRVGMWYCSPRHVHLVLVMLASWVVFVYLYAARAIVYVFGAP